MAEHDTAARPCSLPQEQPETSGVGAASWGTCEELLLVSAVKRHGVNNWNLISSELKARAITLNVNPLFFSEAACKHKYDVLRGRFASSSSSTISQDEEVGNDMHWFEELRKIRVAHLKRELEHYDGSIGSLQVKIKRLKAKKAGDIAANKQLGKSIANPEPNDQVREASVGEVPVQCSSIDDEFGNDFSNSSCLKPCSEASLALDISKNLQDNALIQDPVDLQHVNPGCDQWHDAVEELQDTFSGPTNITVDADVQRDLHQSGDTQESSKLDHRVERDDGAASLTDTVIIVPQVQSEDGLDELQGVQAAEFASLSQVNENMRISSKVEEADLEQSKDPIDKSAESLSRDHEAGLLVLDSVNVDQPKAGVESLHTVEQRARDLVQDGFIIVQPDSRVRGDETLSATADAISNVDTSEDGGTAQPDYVEGHSVVSPTSSLLQPSESTSLEKADDKQPEAFTIIEDPELSLNSDQNPYEIPNEPFKNMVKTAILPKETHVEADLSTQSDAVPVLDTEHDHKSGQISSVVLEHENMRDARDSHRIDESSSYMIQHGKIDRIISSRLLSGISKLHENLPYTQLLKEVTTSSLEIARRGSEFNTSATEGVRNIKDYEKPDVSLDVAVGKRESSMSQDGAMITSEQPECEKSAMASGSLYPSPVELKSSSPEGHIVIALDEPSDNALSCGSKSVVPASTEEEMVSTVDMNIGLDAVSVEAESMEGKEQVVGTSCQDVASGESDGKSTAHLSSADAMDLLKEDGTLPDKASETPLISVELVQKSQPEKSAATSELSLPSGMEASNFTNNGSAISERVENCKQMVETRSKVVDVPSTSRSDVKTDVGQVTQDSEVGHNVADVEHVDPHAVLAAVVPKLQTLPVCHTDIDPASNYGRDSSEFQVACIGNERKLQGIILDVKLEISKEESLRGQTSVSRQQLSESISEGSRGRDLDIRSSPNETEGRDQSDRGLVMESTELKPLTVSPAKVKEEVIEYVRARNLQEIMDSAPKSGIKLKAEPNSPVQSLAGDLESKVSSSHEGSDSVQEQYKDGGDQSGEREERRQQSRDYGESQNDKSESGSPVDGNDGMSPSSRRNRREPRVPGKLVMLLEVLRNICNHKSAYIFKGRPEASRYNLLIRRPMDLTTVRTRLEEGVYSGSSEFFRDLLLIFNNAMVFYAPGSTEFLGAKALFAEATKEMERITQTEALLKRDGPATRTRESKKQKTVVGVVVPTPTVGTSSGKLVGSNPSVTSLPDISSRKRPNTRMGTLETSTNSGAVVDSEGGAARSASVNIIVGPSTSRAEETRDSHDNDQEVNGTLKGGKKLHVGGGSSKGVTRQEELQEGTSLKIGVNKATGGAKLRDLKDVEITKPPALPARPAGAGKLKAERENEQKKEKEREKKKEKLKVSQRDDIDDDDFLLRKGKSLAKLKDQENVQERVPDTKPSSKARASLGLRSASNSQDTPVQSLARPVRGAARKAASTAKEPARAPEQQPKKRVRK